MVNAAEPVDGPSIDAFVKAFKPFGLPDGVIFPTYGLAEHTVFVCSGGESRPEWWVVPGDIKGQDGSGGYRERVIKIKGQGTVD